MTRRSISKQGELFGLPKEFRFHWAFGESLDYLAELCECNGLQKLSPAFSNAAQALRLAVLHAKKREIITRNTYNPDIAFFTDNNDLLGKAAIKIARRRKKAVGTLLRNLPDSWFFGYYTIAYLQFGTEWPTSENTINPSTQLLRSNACIELPRLKHFLMPVAPAIKSMCRLSKQIDWGDLGELALEIAASAPILAAGLPDPPAGPIAFLTPTELDAGHLYPWHCAVTVDRFGMLRALRNKPLPPKSTAAGLAELGRHACLLTGNGGKLLGTAFEAASRALEPKQTQKLSWTNELASATRFATASQAATTAANLGITSFAIVKITSAAESIAQHGRFDRDANALIESACSSVELHSIGQCLREPYPPETDAGFCWSLVANIIVEDRTLGHDFPHHPNHAPFHASIEKALKASPVKNPTLLNYSVIGFELVAQLGMHQSDPLQKIIEAIAARYNQQPDFAQPAKRYSRKIPTL